MNTDHETITFIAALFRPADVVELRAINRQTGEVEHEWQAASAFPSILPKAKQWNDAGFDIYIGANPRPKTGAKGDACIKLARTLFCEFDGGATVESVLLKIEAFGLPRPSVILHSGHGVHVYWILAEPITDMAIWVGLQCDLIAALGSDPVIKNSERIMRLSGFANHKRDDGAVCRLIECDPSRVYDLSEISDRLPLREELPVDETQIEALAKKHARKASASQKGSSVIQAFKAAYPIEGMLERLGFTPTARAGCYKHPGKTGAGISTYARDGRSFHFADVDPFNDHKFGICGIHDAFDLYCLSEHRGEMSAAVKAAAALLDMGQTDTKRHLVQNEVSDPKPSGSVFSGPPIALDNLIPPAMPAGIFTGNLGQMIEAVADATETPRELATSMGLAVVAAACQRRFSVRVEHGYVEPLCIWSLAAMAPGNRKTAVVTLMASPLAEWERRKRAEIEPQIKVAESRAKTGTSRIESLRGKAAKASAAEYQALAQEIEQLEAEQPAIPTVPRLFTEDVTMEHLGTMMAANDEGMAIISDEAGIFDMLGGRYSNNIPNLDLALKSYSRSYVRTDRGSRASISMNHPTLTLGLSPQPEVLQGLAAKPGFKGRGLLDRPLYLLPVSRLGYRKLEPRPVPEHVRDEFARDITDLIEVTPRITDDGQSLSHVLELSADAWNVWKTFQRDVETMMKPDGKLSGLSGWASKLPGNIARVAGLMHCAAETFRAVSVREIPADTMGRAIQFGHLLIDHARVVFREMGADPAMEAARKLWDVIHKNQQPTFRARDAWHPLRGKYKRVVEVDAGFEVLVDHGLIAEVGEPDSGRRGRPSRAFTVHPEVAEMWARGNIGHFGHGHNEDILDSSSLSADLSDPIPLHPRSMTNMTKKVRGAI